MTGFTQLLDGYRHFRETDWVEQRDRWLELAEGQSPEVMIIACSDSRVDPTRILDSSPGETFIVRNVAALVPPFETTPGQHGVSAALEFAVQFLKVKEVVVMGHGACGGCSAALSQDMKDAPLGKGGFIQQWISLLDPARREVIDRCGSSKAEGAQLAMEHAAVRTSIANLRTFPCIQEKEPVGEVKLVGAWFAIETGKLHILDEDSDEFHAVE